MVRFQLRKEKIGPLGRVLHVVSVVHAHRPEGLHAVGLGVGAHEPQGVSTLGDQIACDVAQLGLDAVVDALAGENLADRSLMREETETRADRAIGDCVDLRPLQSRRALGEKILGSDR